MIKIFVFTTSLLFGVVLLTFGQTDSIPNQEITVYLRNGKFVHGYQTLSPFEGYLTVEVDQFTLKHVPYRKIRYILNGPPLPEPPPVYKPMDNTFILSLLFGIQYGSEQGDNLATISFAAGYVFHPLLEASVGIGFMQYDPVSTTTLFVRTKGVFIDGRWSPFYFAEVGSSRVHSSFYDFGLELLDTRGGLMLHPGFGIQRRFRAGAVFLQMGYRIQRAELNYQVSDFWGGTLEVQERLTYRRVTVHLGVSF